LDRRLPKPMAFLKTLIQGKQDIISAEIGEISLKAFPNSKMILLENCKHYGWLDAEEKYFNTIESFLKL
jgi:proline iminopeptidase